MNSTRLACCCTGISALPMGLRAGLAALEKLGVERAKDGQLVALIEIGQDHCATCYADGIQMATGCTFGKGNIQKLSYGKFALTLIDRKSGGSIRVVTRPETIRKNKESEFIGFRMQGVPASQIDPRLVEPLVDYILDSDDDVLLVCAKFLFQDRAIDHSRWKFVFSDARNRTGVAAYAFTQIDYHHPASLLRTF